MSLGKEITAMSWSIEAQKNPHSRPNFIPKVESILKPVLRLACGGASIDQRISPQRMRLGEGNSSGLLNNIYLT
jgi:hypothetical protein